MVFMKVLSDQVTRVGTYRKKRFELWGFLGKYPWLIQVKQGSQCGQNEVRQVTVTEEKLSDYVQFYEDFSFFFECYSKLLEGVEQSC